MSYPTNSSTKTSAGRIPAGRLASEAEAVAFVVCHSIRLDTNTAASDYIALYQGDLALRECWCRSLSATLPLRSTKS